MNKYAKRWIEELRSGKHRQGKGYLQRIRRFHGELKTYRCCLGVACEIYRQETGLGRWVQHPVTKTISLFVLDDGSESDITLPNQVREFFGLHVLTGEVGKFQGTSLAQMNDQGRKFPTIAKAIEEHEGILFRGWGE